MKKLLLSIIFALISFTTTLAVDLNPFAYGLSSSLSDDQSTLTVNYKLTSTAESVRLLIYDGEELIKTEDCSSKGLNAGSYSVDVSTVGLHEGVKLTWKIEVNGISVQAPAELLTKNYDLYHPSSVDIDNNPENPTFGMILTNEGLQEVVSKKKSDGGSYLGTGFGAGLFVFDAAFNLIPNGKNPGYNGGYTFPVVRSDLSVSTPNTEIQKAHVPRRIRISADGRIFVTSMNTDGVYLWEVDTTDFNVWNPVFKGTSIAADRNLYNGDDFVAGPNVGFDVRGIGEDLQLLMLSANNTAYTYAQRGFLVSQYNLGTSTEWTSLPSKSFPCDNVSNSEGNQSYFVAPTQSQVQFDKDGGVWYISYRGTSSKNMPGLAHFTSAGIEDYKAYNGSDKKDEISGNNLRNAAFRFNDDFTKVIIAGVKNGQENSKKATIYSVGENGNAPKLTEETVIDMSTLGNNLNDFAWDYAGNLYAVSNSGEKIVAWVMPYSGQVITPAASKYGFELTPNVQGEMTPFAYNLTGTYDENDLTLTVGFSLNSSATNVKVVVNDGTTDYVVKEYRAADYDGVIPKGNYEATIDVSHLPYDVNLTWRVDVKGKAVDVVTFVDNSNKLFSPTSIDIDNNPQNDNFGTVFCIEGKSGGINDSKFLSYWDSNGAGLYVFNADGTPRPIPNQNVTRYGYNGGANRVNQNPDVFYSYVSSGKTYSRGAYSPFRVRVSDDGRIFITSLTTDGQVLWEVDKRVFSNPNDKDWGSYTSWKRVISTYNNNTNLQTTSNTSNEFENVYNLYTSGGAASGQFIAGPNMGFDVRGSGNQLKLLMLSGSKRAIAHTVMGQFRCDEYDLGEKTEWTEPASRKIFSGDVLNYQGVQVQYDENGNVWMCQHRTGSGITLKMHNTNGGDGYTEDFTAYRRCGAIRFNEDFTQVAIASKGSGQGGAITIYPVLGDGTPDWNNGKEVNIYAKAGYSIMDIAWDYANNLYIAADAPGIGECIAIYATPHDENDVVSTPAKNSFVVACQEGGEYRVRIEHDPVKGSVTCTRSAYNGIVSAEGMNVPSCVELTVTAVPKAYCRFVNWTNSSDVVVSTNPEYTFSANNDITLTANFEAEDFNVTWHNLFVDDDDIFSPTLDADRNARLWYLFMPYYNVDGTDTDRWIQANLSTGEYNVMGFCYTSTDELMQGGAMDWLGEYFRTKVNSLNTGDNCYAYSACMFAFINRVGYAKNHSGDKLSGTYQGIKTSELSVFANGAAEPEEWRPWWAEHACGLKATMAYGERLPIGWTKADGPAGYDTKVDGYYDTYTTNLPTSGKLTKTPLWYKWNKVKTIPNGSDDTHILAWRDGSTTGPIVEYVSRPDMKLYATYVKKNIDENNAPANPNNYDATNEDVVMLLTNPNYGVGATHSLNITRKLVAGMYNTICMPFDVVVEGQYGLSETHPLKGATILDFTGVTKTNNLAGEAITILEFTQVNSMQAGRPYLIKLKEGSQDITSDLMFTGIGKEKITLTPQTSENIGGITFNGVINPTTVPEGSIILVADDRLALTTDDGEMLGMRGYFTIDKSDPIWAADISAQAADGRVYLSMKKPVTTSIPVAPEAEQQLKPEVRKIMYDGQIYILRGDEVYTITGHRVK